MLLQSYSGIIEIFPAVPESWSNIGFNNLRAEGAFLISAKKENGITVNVSIRSVQGGICRTRLPFNNFKFNDETVRYKVADGITEFYMAKGQVIEIVNTDDR
jgi:alpha-L-fucosidase 2